MNQFSTQQSSTSARRRIGPVVALAVVLVGGGAFAAAGGIDMIRSLFVTVELQGQPVQLELQPVAENTYEGSMTTQLEDGRNADIHVVRTDPDENSRQMEVRVAVSGEDGEGDGERQVTQEVHHKKMKVGRPDPNATFTLNDLGGTEPIHTWTNEQGEAKAVYTVNNAEKGLLEIYSTLGKADGSTVVKQLAQLPADVFEGTPEVTVADNGDLRLVWDSGEGEQGNRREIRLRDKNSLTKHDEEIDIEAGPPGATIKLRMSADPNEPK
jgi:hypothetical protein